MLTIGSLSTTTAADGTYTLYHVPAGNSEISVSLGGYSSGEDNFTVTQGANTGHDFSLVPNIVEGTITDTVTGADVHGVMVTIAGVSATSGVNGFYEIIAVPSGNDQPLSAISTGARYIISLFINGKRYGGRQP